jgi:hypothetical protein
MRTAVAVLLLIHGAAVQAQAPEILVLGTFHMANPGRDLHNTQVDDVLGSRRQAEIQEVLDVLKRFRPTKVAVEANVSSRRVAQEYADYVAGKYTLTRNEIDQLGYRLAKELGHSTVHAVDESGDFPYYRVQNWAIANDRKAHFDSAQARAGDQARAQSEFLRAHTILETLAMLNADSTAKRAVGEYYLGFMPFGQPYEYAGPDLIASWFQRNLRIYHNIRKLAAPGERIVVIYGHGHLAWLRQIASSDPAVRLRHLNDLIPTTR